MKTTAVHMDHDSILLVLYALRQFSDGLETKLSQIRAPNSYLKELREHAKRAHEQLSSGYAAAPVPDDPEPVCAPEDDGSIRSYASADPEFQ